METPVQVKTDRGPVGWGFWLLWILARAAGGAVGEPAVNYHRELALVVQEALEVIQRLGQLLHRRRDEGGLG